MIGTAIKYAAAAVLCTALGTSLALAEDTPTDDDASTITGAMVTDSALKLKDAEDIPSSAQQLQLIAIESLPAKIDLATILGSIPGSAVSAQAQGLRGLERGEIPGAARGLRGTAHGGLPGPAASHPSGGHAPSLPSPARGRGKR